MCNSAGQFCACGCVCGIREEFECSSPLITEMGQSLCEFVCVCVSVCVCVRALVCACMRVFVCRISRELIT